MNGRVVFWHLWAVLSLVGALVCLIQTYGLAACFLLVSALSATINAAKAER